MGIPSLTYSIPVQRAARIEDLQRSALPQARMIWQTEYIQNQLSWCQRRCRTLGVKNTQEIRPHFARALHGSNDGKELSEIPGCQYSSDWILSNSEGIPAANYRSFHKVHINVLPTRVRTTRGRISCVRNYCKGSDCIAQMSCHAGCLNVTETAVHVVQNCPRTHGGRVKCHDAVCAGLVGYLKRSRL